MNASDLRTHDHYVQQGATAGLIPLYWLVSTAEEWDHYEWLCIWAAEVYARFRPEDLDNQALLQRAHTGRFSTSLGGDDGWDGLPIFS